MALTKSKVNEIRRVLVIHAVSFYQLVLPFSRRRTLSRRYPGRMHKTRVICGGTLRQVRSTLDKKAKSITITRYDDSCNEEKWVLTDPINWSDDFTEAIRIRIKKERQVILIQLVRRLFHLPLINISLGCIFAIQPIYFCTNYNYYDNNNIILTVLMGLGAFCFLSFGIVSIVCLLREYLNARNDMLHYRYNLIGYSSVNDFLYRSENSCPKMVKARLKEKSVLIDVFKQNQTFMHTVKSAKHGCAKDQFNVGNNYENGLVVKQNYAEALKWYNLAVTNDPANLDFKKCRDALISKMNPSLAKRNEELKRLIQIAEGGNAKAQYEIGNRYARGLGMEQDYAKAVKWFRKSAEQGDASAQRTLAEFYEKGRGVIRDYVQAAKWYLKSAEIGDALAERKLGDYYENGQGGIRDFAEAIKWYRRAGMHGDAYSQGRLAFYYANGLLGVIKNHVEALKWIILAINNDPSNLEYQKSRDELISGMHRPDIELAHREANALTNMERDNAKCFKCFRCGYMADKPFPTSLEMALSSSWEKCPNCGVNFLEFFERLEDENSIGI